MNLSLPLAARRAACSSVLGALACLLFASLHAAPPAGRGFKSVPDFQDEFDAGSVNTTLWDYRNDERILDGKPQCANRPSQVSQNGDGFLRIVGNVRNVVVNGTTYPTVGGGVISRQTFKYGYYETRAKLTSESGWHPAFWLFGGSANGNVNVNEIDGFEIDSAYPAKICWNTHYYVPNYVSWPKAKFDLSVAYNIPSGNSSTDFHTYAWEWTPDEVIFYFGLGNGPVQEIRRIPYPGPHADQKVWLTLLGWERFNQPRSLNDAPIAFDYFRYYAKDYGIGSGLGRNGGRLVASPAYSSGWGVSTSAFDQNSGNTTYFSNQPGARATWTPNLPATRNYEVFAWNPSFYSLASTSPLASYVINGSNGSSTSPAIDQTMDGQEWISLGTYKLNAGSSGNVTLTVPPSPSGSYRAAGMMFRAFDLADCDFDVSADSLTTLSGTWSRVPLTGYSGNHGYRTASSSETVLRSTQSDDSILAPYYATRLPSLTNYQETIGNPSDDGAGPSLWYETSRSSNSGTGGASYTLSAGGAMTAAFTDYFGNPNLAFGMAGNSTSGAAVAGSTGLFATGARGTISFLFKTPPTLSGFASLFNQGSFALAHQFEVGINGNTLRFGTMNGGTKVLTNGPVLTPNTWYSFAMRWDLSVPSNNLTWYLGEGGGATLNNGNITITASGNPTQPIYFGGRTSGSVFNGAFQHIAIYQRSLGPWQNNFVRGSFQLNQAGSNAGVIARFQGPDYYYALRMDCASGTLAILRKSGGVFSTLASISYPIDRQYWQNLMLIVKNDGDAVALRGLVNGREELAFRDTAAQRIVNGTVGVRVWHSGAGDVILDNFGAGR